MKIFLVTTFLAIACACTAFAETAKPLFVAGPACPEGSARPNKWAVYEDRNGDGYYDFITVGFCDGSVHSGTWEAINPDPVPSPSAVLCTFPTMAAVAHNLTSTLLPGGLYAWRLEMRNPATDALLGTVYRSSNGDLGCTYGGEDLD